MPLQNRVTPQSALVSTPGRGMLMGNRGCLHTSDQQLVRHHVGNRWIICLLAFKGRRRQVMANGRYTELFFLDEATALAAGHRPCAECQRARFNAFRARWAAANPEQAHGGRLSADALDAVLHAERVHRVGRRHWAQVTYAATLAELPSGAFITLPDDTTAYLVQHQSLLAWSPQGYGPPHTLSPITLVTVLTPRSVVRTLAAGYVPIVHSSACSVR